jgi:hypothetical protein
MPRRLAGGTRCNCCGGAGCRARRPRRSRGHAPVGLFSSTCKIEQAIDVTREIGFDVIEWAVRPGGHISPERVETDLPRPELGAEPLAVR